MKLAQRPKNRPIGATGATRSPSLSMSIRFWRANRATAAQTPRKPPWKDMPPSQILKTASGFSARPARCSAFTSM